MTSRHTSNAHDPIETKDNATDPTPTRCVVKKRRGYRRYPKPPYSYVGLIATAILNSPDRRLTLRGIISGISEMFSFFSGEYQGWHDSVRHSLSHCECFRKLPNLDKSRWSFWVVDLSKIPRNAFTRQNSTPEGKSGKWAPYLHQQLKQKPVELPPLDVKVKAQSESFANPRAASRPYPQNRVEKIKSAINLSTTSNATPKSLSSCQHQVAQNSDICSHPRITSPVGHYYTIENIGRYQNEILRHKQFPEEEIFRVCDEVETNDANNHGNFPLDVQKRIVEQNTDSRGSESISPISDTFTKASFELDSDLPINAIRKNQSQNCPYYTPSSHFAERHANEHNHSYLPSMHLLSPCYGYAPAITYPCAPPVPYWCHPDNHVNINPSCQLSSFQHERETHTHKTNYQI